jgi:hypothetical protein
MSREIVLKLLPLGSIPQNVSAGVPLASASTRKADDELATAHASGRKRWLRSVTSTSPISAMTSVSSFFLRKVPSLLFESDERPQMAVTRLKLPNGLPEPTAPVRPKRGFTINVHLQQPVCRSWGTWVDGKFHPVSSWQRGAIRIYDLESNPIALRSSAFDM